MKVIVVVVVVSEATLWKNDKIEDSGRIRPDCLGCGFFAGN